VALNAVSIYRLARFAYLRRMPIFPRLLKALIFVGFNSILPYEADIGQGSKLAHGGIGVVIHPRAFIGRNVLIGQGVTIGARSRRTGAPTIGDGVYIGAGARILGNIVVGSFSIIGANAVVISDVPERSAVGGVPARLLRENVDIGEFEDLPQQETE
jgi:serine O-acetyltransferase